MSFLTLNLCPLFAHSGRCLFSVICPIILRSGSIKLNLNQPLSEDLTLPVFGSLERRRRIDAYQARKHINYCEIWIIASQEGNVADYCPEWINQPDSGSATK